MAGQYTLDVRIDKITTMLTTEDEHICSFLLISVSLSIKTKQFHVLDDWTIVCDMYFLSNIVKKQFDVLPMLTRNWNTTHLSKQLSISDMSSSQIYLFIFYGCWRAGGLHYEPNIYIQINQIIGLGGAKEFQLWGQGVKKSSLSSLLFFMEQS